MFNGQLNFKMCKPSVLLFFAAGYYSKMEASAFLLFEAGWLWRSKIMYE